MQHCHTPHAARRTRPIPFPLPFPLPLSGYAGHHLVSGSADETIKVYDLARQKEVGTLFEQQGTLTCLEFFQGAGGGVGARHMLSGSEDGSIVVWDAKAWDSMKVLRGHKGAVVDLSIHPTGRLALSVGRYVCVVLCASILFFFLVFFFFPKSRNVRAQLRTPCLKGRHAMSCLAFSL